MSVPVRRAAIAAACSLASAAAQAQTEAPQRELGTVTITGGQPTSLPTQIPTTIEGVTAEQIQRSINATDSQDALKYLPSLLVRKRYIGDYNHAVLSTRASGTGNPARSMVYADGILLSNYLGNGPTNAPRWMLVAPEEIDRVDVLYGPFSAAYPGNSVGAVVDYVTRMPKTFEAHGKVSFQHQPFNLYNTDDTYNGYQIGASAGNKAGDWSWFFSLTHTRSEGQPLTFATRTLAQGTVGNAGTPVTGAVLDLDRTNNPWYLLGTGTEYTTTQNVFKLKLAYDISSTLKAQYTLGLWNNRADGKAATYLRDAAGNPVYSGTVNIAGRSFNLNGATPLFGQTREDITHVMHGFTLKTQTRDTWDWSASVSQYDYATDELRRNTTVLPGAFSGGAGTIVDSDGTGWTTLDLRGTWRPQGIGGTHIVDMGVQRDHYTLRTRDNATTHWITGAPGALTAAFGGDSTLTSLWAQDTWRLAKDWKAVLGGRLENWQTDKGYRIAGNASVAYAERSENYFSPKAALSWQAAPQWVLKASTGRAIRVPTVSELYQGGVNNLGQTTNNDPNLRPEKSWTTELTAERDLGNGLLRFTGFFERTRDALYTQTNVLTNVNNIQNVDRISTQGLEVAYQANDVFTRGIDLLGSVTWADSQVKRNDKFPASVGKRQIRVPEWRASGAVTWRPDDRWSYTLGARYSGEQFSTLDNTDINGFAYTAASRYFTTDVRVTWKVSPKSTLAFGIDNLNNYQYWAFHPYPQRTFHLEFKTSL